MIAQIYSQKLITSATIGGVTNVIEAAVENVLEVLIANNLHWNICSMPVSSDSCYECGDAIIHIDAKTINIDDNDNKYNKVNVEASQTTYSKGTPFIIKNKTWEAKLNLYEEHVMFGKIPNLTYILKIIYSNDNFVEKIKLISLSHGQLQEDYGGKDILNAGKNGRWKKRSNIRFNENKIANIRNWRIKLIYERK